MFYTLFEHSVIIGFQIILSPKLPIQNNNHTQEHKYLCEMEKSRDKLRINSLLSNQSQ